MQTQIKMTGELSPCRCGKQPKHYEEKFGALHFLECSPCQTRTPKFPAFQEAVHAWETQDTGIIAKAVA